MPVYMNTGKIGAGRVDGWTGGREIEGSTRGPRGPKNIRNTLSVGQCAFVYLERGAGDKCSGEECDGGGNSHDYRVTCEHSGSKTEP